MISLVMEHVGLYEQQRYGKAAAVGTGLGAAGVAGYHANRAGWLKKAQGDVATGLDTMTAKDVPMSAQAAAADPTKKYPGIAPQEPMETTKTIKNISQYDKPIGASKPPFQNITQRNKALAAKQKADKEKSDAAKTKYLKDKEERLTKSKKDLLYGKDSDKRTKLALDKKFGGKDDENQYSGAVSNIFKKSKGMFDDN